MENKINADSLVWAKLKYCSYWPARVVNAPPELGKVPRNRVCVLFFGSKNFGFVESQNVVEYIQNCEKYKKKGKGQQFQEAIQSMEEFISDPKNFASNGYVKPVNKKFTIKKERGPIVKNESDIDQMAYFSENIYCSKDNIGEYHSTQVNLKVNSLKEEKAQLVCELVSTKNENQKLFFTVQEKERQIEKLNLLRSSEAKTFSNEMSTLANQKQAVERELSHLKRDNKLLNIKIKQLHLASNENKPPKLKMSDNENEYEVNKLINHRISKGKREFLVRWKNYPPSCDSWEKESNLNCPHILNSYLKANKFN